GWLRRRGRGTARLALLRVGPGTRWLLLPDGDAGALAAAMGRFVFRSKVKLRVPEELSVCGAFAAPGDAVGAVGATAPGATVASGAAARIDADGDVELDFGDGTTPR